MKCRKYREWMSLYIDNMLNDKELEIFKRHIQNCTSCQKELNELQEVIVNIKNLEEINPPYNFHQALMEKIELENNAEDANVVYHLNKKVKTIPRWKLIGTVAATFVAGIIIVDLIKPNYLNEVKFNETGSQRDIAKGPAQARAFSIEENHMANLEGAYDLKEEILEIETRDYNASIDAVMQIINKMALVAEATNEEVLDETRKQLVIQCSLLESEKENLVNNIKKLYPDASIDLNGEDKTENDTNVKLVIRIKEIK